MAEDNNWAQWIAATGAFTGATAYGARGTDLLDKIRNPYIGPTMTANSNITQRVVREVIKQRGNIETLTETQQNLAFKRLERMKDKTSLANQMEKIPGMKQAISREWEAAKNAVLPTGVDIGSIDATDPLGGVTNILQRSKSVYTQNVFRRWAANVEILNQTGFAGAIKTITDPIPENLLATKASSVPAMLRPYLDEMTDIFGPGIEVKRRGAPGAGELEIFLPGEKKASVTLPEMFGPEGMQRGLARTGAGLHNVYAPGMFSYMDEAGRLSGPVSFSEFKMQQVIEAAKGARAEGITASPRAALREKAAEVDKLMDFQEPSLGGSDFSLETVAKSQRLTVVDESGSVVSGKVAQRILQENPQLTPTSKAGRFQTLNPTQLYGGFTESIDYARKPWQWIKQTRPTAEAQKAIMESQYGTKMFDFLDSPIAIKQFNGPSGPRLRTMYLSDNQIEDLARMGFPIGDGELLMNRNFAKQAEVKRTRRVALSQVSEQLKGLMTPTSTPTAEDVLLGRTLTGELAAGRSGEVIKALEPTRFRGKGGLWETGYNVVLEETLGMGQYEKQFGGLKGMARTMDFSKLPKGMAQFGAIGRLSDLKKDPALRAAQQFSALVTHAAAGRGGAIGDALAKDPLAAMTKLNRSADPTAGLMTLAKEMGLDKGTSHYNRIFGEQMVEGITRLGFGGTKEFTGAGKVGTVEPRILNLLEGRSGAFGGTVGSEVMSRVLMGDPNKLSIHNQLRETFASMVPGAKVPVGVDIRPENMSAVDLADLRKTGGYIATGIPDMPNIYMPGYENIEALAPYKVNGEMIETAPVKKTFKEIERTVQQTLAGEIGADEAMNRFNRKSGYLSQLYQEFAPGGKGMGSLARGQVFGSRFLTAVSGDLRDFSSPTIGISEQMGLEMFREMEEYGMSVEKARARFLEGEDVGAAVARHPFIGTQSMQPVNMRRVEGITEPVMYVPERTISAKVIGIDSPVELTEGILQGMAMDKDADIGMAIALGDNMEETVRSELVNRQSQSAVEFAEHSARMKMLKAAKGAGQGQLSRAQQIAAAGTKLGIVDEYVGRVSTSLSTARAAVVASDLDKASQGRALGLLEWLEQQPISGKHLTAKRVLEDDFSRQMESIIIGAGGDDKVLASTVRSMTASEDVVKQRIATQMLGAGVEFQQPISFLGTQMKSVSGFELDQTALQIAEAVRGFKTERIDDITRAQVEKFMRPGRMTGFMRDQIPAMLEATDMTRNMVESGFREKQKMVMSAINKAGTEISSRVKPLAKPLMMGLAAAGAVGFALSGPPEGMEPPPAPADTVGRMPPEQAAIGRSNRDDIEIPEPGRQQMGNPSTPNPIPRRSVMLDEAQANRARDVRMRVNAQNLTAAQRQTLTSRLNSRFPGTVDVNVRDSRRTLNQHTISDMLD